MRKIRIEYRKTSEIRGYEKNPRRNDKTAEVLAKSIQEFGFKVPIVVDANGVVVCGHARLKAARKLGMEEVPCIVAKDLSEDQIRAFRLADNRIAEFSEWDYDALKGEIEGLGGVFGDVLGDFGLSSEGLDEEEDDGDGEKGGSDGASRQQLRQAIFGDGGMAGVQPVPGMQDSGHSINRIIIVYRHGEEEKLMRLLHVDKLKMLFSFKELSEGVAK